MLFYSLISPLIFLFYLLLVSAEPASAQEFQIKPLYDATANSPRVLMPFALSKKDDATPVEVVSFTFQNNTGLCGAIVDQFQKNIFFLRCEKPIENLRMKIFLKVDAKLHSVEYGPVAIKDAYENLDPIDPDDPTSDPNVLAGKKIYFSYCSINCHQPVNLAGKTSAQIKQAINTIPEMKTFKTSLNEDQINKIVKYLGSVK